MVSRMVTPMAVVLLGSFHESCETVLSHSKFAAHVSAAWSSTGWWSKAIGSKLPRLDLLWLFRGHIEIIIGPSALSLQFDVSSLRKLESAGLITTFTKLFNSF